MIEPEVAFFDLDNDMDLAEDFVKYLINYVLDHFYGDLEMLDKRIKESEKNLPQAQRRPMGLIEMLRFVVDNDFERVTYTEAIELLRRSKPFKKGKFEFEPHWGADLQAEHERFLVEKHFKKPVIVRDYPKDIKAFYMRMNDDGETDFYENFNNDAQVTEHFHEFAMDLQTDKQGNFYYMKGARHALPAVIRPSGRKTGLSCEILS